MIKEVIFFSAANSKDPSNWSNVPFLYSRTLEKKGILVHRISYNPPEWVIKIYNEIFWRISRITKSDLQRGFYQTTLAKWLATPIIRKAIKKYHTSDCCIFMGCGYTNFWTSMPSIMFAESSFDKNIRVRLNRKLTFFEKLIAKQHLKAWQHTDLVTILFPRDIDYIKQLDSSINIHYKGSNVINTLYDGDVDKDVVIPKKNVSKHILFIGGKHYLEGARILITAFKLLHSDDPNLRLDIVALENKDFEELPDGVTCYGYLRKDKHKDNELYYDLMLNAKVFANPTPSWGSYSSCVEAMYYFTPCVVAPYDQFVEEFGTYIEFGAYNKDFTPEGVAESLRKVLYASDYEEMANSAHNRVKDYSWDNYVDWTFEELYKTGKIKR